MKFNDDSLLYIENFRAVKAYLDNSEELNKYRTKNENNTYLINSLFIKKMASIYIISFITPSESKAKDRKFNLFQENDFNLAKVLFREVLNENVALPYFLKFSETVDDNIFINLETQKYLIEIFKKADI